MFKIHIKNTIKIKMLEKDIILITIKERVFHQVSKPTTQNIKGETKP